MTQQTLLAGRSRTIGPSSDSPSSESPRAGCNETIVSIGKRRWPRRSQRPRAGGRGSPDAQESLTRLLHLALSTASLELLHGLLDLALGLALEDGEGKVGDGILRLLEAEGGETADNLDDRDALGG